MDRIRWILAALALLLSSNALASRLLVLPLLAEGVEAERAARIQAAIVEATRSLEGIERLAPRGPTFCTPTDLVCIGTAGRDQGADKVLHATLRPLGDSLSLVLLVVETGGNREVARQAEAIQSSQPVERAVRERIVGLLDPSRHVGSLWVDAPEGSQIFIDGEARGTTPLDRPIEGLSPGQHKLRVVRGGAAEARAFVEIRFANVTRIRIEPRSDQVALEGFDVLEGEGKPHLPRQESGPGSQPTPRFITPAWKWALLGGSAVAVAGGLAASAEGSDIADTRAALRDSDGRFPAERLRREASLRRSHGQRQAWSTGFYVTGGLLAAGAGTLFLIEALQQEESGFVELTPIPGGVGLMGRF